MKRYPSLPIAMVLLLLLLTAACGGGGDDGTETPPQAAETVAWDTMEPNHHMELRYAQQFDVAFYPGDYALITIEDSGRYLLVPEGKAVPGGLEEDIVVLQQPLGRIYLAASSAMDFFRQINALHRVCMTSTERDNWRLPEVVAALDQGDMLYVGKYSEPDYERIVTEGCDLVVESTMIHHSPKTLEQLTALGLPVMVERSSYEPHPLGRMEWVRLYGLLTGRSQEADNWFDQELERLSAVLEQESGEQTVAFFYITANGAANVRKPGDYVAKMIQLAGGRYVFSDLPGEENALSTVNMQMEAFYAEAWDADYLIYNSAIDGELETIDQLVEKDELLADFKAVQAGKVWCTGKSMFQQTTAVGDIILDIHNIVSGHAEKGAELNVLYRLT